jgi:filamentous hemagglutinin family protein
MNRMYRLIWSESIKAFVPAAEITRRRGKRSGGGNALAGAVIAGVTVLASGAAVAGEPTHSGGAIVVAAPTTLAPPPATALPTAPQVTSGAASVVANGTQLTVTESTSSAAINWNTFNIGSAAGVTFVQPGSSSVILNRVLSADPSQIYGTMTSNGIVFLINPQGIVFGQGAEVNVGGLVASSLSLSDKNLLAGNWSFTAGTGAGAVSNAGTIRVTPGGFAALLGGRVGNTGSIAARLGSVALASGSQITLDLDDGGLLKVGVAQATLNAMVANSGAIIADGGRIILTAKSANELLATVVNNTGVLRAEGIGERDGQIWLLAADPLANTGANGAAANAHAVQGAAGAVASSGSIDVSGAGGGEATLAGTSVTLSGTITAGSGGEAGGRVLLNSTQATTLAAGSVVDLASAGTGGKLVAWSDGATNALGMIDARGTGAQGGGGTVEISAGGTLGFDATVQLGAASATRAGTLILDPATLEIAPGSGTAPDTVYQSALQTQSGNIVLSATGQITIDALTNNVLNLANATSLNITSQNSGGISFVNGAGGRPSGITTHDAPVTLLAGGSGSLDNVGQITTNGGDINLSGVYVHLAGGLDATNGGSTPGNVALSIFGGGILSSSANPIAGGQVLLDATYGYIGSASSAVPTATSDLIVKTGGNAYVSDSSAMASLALTSNHLEGSPVGIDISAPNVVLTGSDAIGDGSLYSAAVRWTNYSASNPGGLTGPSAVTITEDGNLLPQNINLPATALTLTSSQGSILGGNAAPIVANTLTMASTLAIGGTDFSGGNAENDLGTGGNTLLTQAGSITANVITAAGNITGIVNLTQQGDLLGSVQASQVLLQASGKIGSRAAPFALDTSTSGQVDNLAAGGDLFVNAQFLNTLVFTNVQAGGDLNLAMDTPNGYLVQVNRAMAGGNLNVSGSQFSFLWVQAATATNGSIAITNEGALEVDAATLNGTGAVNRAIDLTSDASQVVFGLLSTNGPAGSAAAALPLGNIVIAAPQGYIADLALGTEGGGVSALRAANATLTASTGIGLANTEVDTHTNLVLTAGVPGGEGGEIEGNLSGIDSVSDPTGSAPHAIHLANVRSYGGTLSLSNSNGDFEVGSVRSYNDYGSDGSSPGGISLLASGSIVADGSVGGGRINAADLTGNGGSITLTAGGNLGTRGTGSDGTTGASPLSLNGSSC